MKSKGQNIGNKYSLYNVVQCSSIFYLHLDMMTESASGVTRSNPLTRCQLCMVGFSNTCNIFVEPFQHFIKKNLKIKKNVFIHLSEQHQTQSMCKVADCPPSSPPVYCQSDTLC